MSTKTKNNKGVKLIKKANDLIEARYRFDIWETRVFTTVLGEIHHKDEDFRTYRIYLRDIIKEFDINNGDAYDMLRQATRSLMNKKFYVNYEHDGAIREQIFHIIRKADVMKEMLDENRREANEYVDISIEPEMKPLLLELKSRFTTYDMRNIIKFKSSYTLRIYEHLKQYESIGKRSIDIDYLKRIFEITTEYPLFANFYQKVIQPAFRDINQHTDLTITHIEKQKIGKKVESLLFIFKSKNKEDSRNNKKLLGQQSDILKLPLEVTVIENQDAETLPNNQQGEKDRLFIQFQNVVVGEFGVSPSVFLTELNQYSEVQLSKAVRVTKRAAQEGKVKNLSGFFIEALRKDFTDAKEEQAVKKQQKLDKERQIEILQDEYAAQINDKIRDLTLTFPNLTQESIEALKEAPFYKKYIIQQEEILGKKLEVEDFRQDKKLREGVKLKIMELQKEEFEAIWDNYNSKMRILDAIK